MKTFFRSFRFAMFFVAILCLCLGLAVLLWPDYAVKVLCYGFGGVLVLAGVLQIAAYLAGDRKGILPKLMMLSAFISVVMGVWVLLSPEKVRTLAMIVMGIVLLYHGAMDIKYSFDVRSCGGKSWSAVLLCGLATCGIGVLMLVNPFDSMDTLFFVAGLGFLFDGITDLFTVVSVAGSKARYEHLISAEPVIELETVPEEPRLVEGGVSAPPAETEPEKTEKEAPAE